MPIDFRRLQILTAVAQASTLAAAARKLEMTQPGVSQALKALEAEVGFMVARRSGRKLELTPAGRKLASDAAVAFHCVDVSLAASKAISEGRAGVLRIAFTDAALSAIASGVLKRLHADAPDLDLEIFEMPTDDQAAALRDGRIDAAFLHPPIDDDLDIHPLIDEPLLAVMSADTAPKTRGEISLSKLSGERFILFPRMFGPFLYDRIITAFDTAGFAPRLSAALLPWRAASALAAAGLGVALTPASILSPPPAGSAVFTLRGSDLSVPHALVFRRGPRTDTEKRLLTFARAAARNAAPPDLPRKKQIGKSQ